MNFRSAGRASLLASLLMLGACSSAGGLKAFFMGDSEEAATADRAPASNGRAVTLDNGGDSQLSRLAPAADPSGPNLGQNEFNALKKQSDDAASRGFRRAADPWDGTGPVNEGSLWNADGQDNFYFSKNLLHKVGDIVIVKIEPDVTDALNTKIASLMGRNSVNQVVADEAGKAVGAKVSDKISKAIGNQNIGNAVGAVAQDRTIAAIEEKVKYLDVEEIPVRIVETLPRNSFRIEGTRRVTIKNAPYMLKMAGVLRDEDIGPAAMVASSKIIESKLELTR